MNIRERRIFSITSKNFIFYFGAIFTSSVFRIMEIVVNNLIK